MTKELNYSPLFQFSGKSAEISFFSPNFHSTYCYEQLQIDINEDRLKLEDKQNGLVWTLIHHSDIKDVVFNEDSQTVDIMRNDGTFVTVCENNLGMGNFDLAEFE